MGPLGPPELPLRHFWGTVTSIFQTNDSGYVIVSTEFAHAYVSTPLQMFKLDSNGNLQWNQTYSWHIVSSQSSIYTLYAKSSILLSDGYLIVGGANIAGKPETGLILKTDLNGNLIWNKTYAYSGMPSTINSVSLSNNGSLMFVGYADKNVGATTYGSYTWVAQMDNLGNVQGQLAIDMGNHLSNPASIIRATDGGHIFVGVWNETTGFINQQFWLVKISTTASSIPEFSNFDNSATFCSSNIAINCVYQKENTKKIAPSLIFEFPEHIRRLGY